MMPNLPALARLLRPKQWVKNTFVCAGVIFGARLHDGPLLQAMALTFVAFSLMGSSVYVVNDYLDRESDRKHPTKRSRPLASGALTPFQGFTAAAACVSGSVLAAWTADPRVLLLVLVYLAINIAYSLKLKHQAVTDVFCIASGFMLRILAGTWGIHIAPSGWLLLTGMFLTLFLGFAKRRAEWADAAGVHTRRPVLDVYSPELLDTFLSITATGTVLSVLFGLFRYLFLLHRHNRGENPSRDVFTDHQIVACALAYAGTALWLLNR